MMVTAYAPNNTEDDLILAMYVTAGWYRAELFEAHQYVLEMVEFSSRLTDLNRIRAINSDE